MASKTREEHLNVHAASVPNTRYHLKFLGEIDDALVLLGIPFRTEVFVDYDDQASYVRFYTDSENKEHLASIIKIVSEYNPSREILQKEYRKMKKGTPSPMS